MNQKCCLCGAELNSEANDANPIYDGQCCNRCFNNIVKPSRIYQYKNDFNIEVL